MREVFVESVRYNPSAFQYAMLLKDKTSTGVVAIWIDQAAAEAIVAALHDIKPERPNAYDLFAAVLYAAPIHLMRVIIHSIVNNIFHATIVFEINGSQRSFDARPSDAIALALRVRAPVFMEDRLFETYAVPLDKIGRAEEQKQLPSPPPPSEEEKKKLKPFYDAFGDKDLDPQ